MHPNNVIHIQFIFLQTYADRRFHESPSFVYVRRTDLCPPHSPYTASDGIYIKSDTAVSRFTRVLYPLS